MAVGVEWGAKYTLTGPDGTIAVFNDSTSPNYVGILSPESSGLDSPDIREDAADVVEGDGGTHGTFYAGRRPIVLVGTIIASSATQRSERIEKLRRASRALRSNATLEWEPTGGPAGGLLVTVRRQQPLRITKGYVKEFQIPLVAADPRIYADPETKTSSYAPPTNSGVKSPSTAETVAPGETAWTNPGNAKVSDNVWAEAVLTENKNTQFLKCTGFGFAIPGTATILGVKVFVERNQTGASGNCEDNVIKLLKAGVQVGKNKAVAVKWPVTTDATATYGGTTDLWEETWTPAQINAATFGVSVQAFAGLGASNARVDLISITVYYEDPTGRKFSVTNSGDAESPPILKAYGPTTNPTIKNLTTGKSITVETTLATEADYIEIDMAKITAKLKGITDVGGSVNFPADWWMLQPGANELEFPPGSKAEVISKSAWM